MNLLTSLLLLTPALALPAPQEPSITAQPKASGTAAAAQESGSSDLPGCHEEVKNFRGWDLKAFSLKSTTSRSNPVFSLRSSTSTLSFSVENSILDYAVDCKAEAQVGSGAGNGTSGAKEFDGSSEFTCEAPEGAAQNGKVTFTFDEESGEVSLKQKWTCYDDPTYPTYYTGTGQATADLDCETGDDEVNEAWEVGSEEEFASKKKECKETEVHVELDEISAIA